MAMYEPVVTNFEANGLELTWYGVVLLVADARCEMRDARCEMR